VGPLLVSVLAPVVATLKQRLVAWGIMSAAALILIFAVSYFLDAAHALLLTRYGSVSASLIIAGLLLATAAFSVGLALFLRRPRASPQTALLPAPYRIPLRKIHLSRQRNRAIAAALAGAISAMTAIAGSKRLRALMAGRTLVDPAPPDERG
jgi:hypothetical protein